MLNRMGNAFGNSSHKLPQLREAMKSPVYGVVFMKPNMIEYTAESVTVRLDDEFNAKDVSSLIKSNVNIDRETSNKIVYTLNHNDMRAYNLEKMHEINFVNSNCKCVLKIINTTQQELLRDKAFAINLSTIKS